MTSSRASAGMGRGVSHGVGSHSLSTSRSLPHQDQFWAAMAGEDGGPKREVSDIVWEANIFPPFRPSLKVDFRDLTPHQLPARSTCLQIEPHS